MQLTRTEARNPLFKGKLGMNTDGDFTLVLGKTACHFLDRRTGHCKIYEDRPMACRGYVCHEAGGYSTEVILKYPALLRHLKRKGIEPAPVDCVHYCAADVPGYERRLRDLRGRRSQRVLRYSLKSREYKEIGRFDRRGKFHRKPHV